MICVGLWNVRFSVPTVTYLIICFAVIWRGVLLIRRNTLNSQSINLHVPVYILSLSIIIISPWAIHNLNKAHGPHRSPEETVQINTYIWLYHNVDSEKKKPIIYFMRIYWFIVWTNLNPLHPRMLCAKFGWNWPRGSGEEDENAKNLQTDGRTDRQTDDGQQVIRTAHLSFQLRWAKNVKSLWQC